MARKTTLEAAEPLQRDRVVVRRRDRPQGRDSDPPTPWWTWLGWTVHRISMYRRTVAACGNGPGVVG